MLTVARGANLGGMLRAMHRRKFSLMLAGCVALALLGCGKKDEADAGGKDKGGELKSLTVDDVAKKVDAKDGKTFVFDNNSKDRFDKGHVPTAKWVPKDKVTAEVLPGDKAATLVFYCANEG